MFNITTPIKKFFIDPCALCEHTNKGCQECPQQNKTIPTIPQINGKKFIGSGEDAMFLMSGEDANVYS